MAMKTPVWTVTVQYTDGTTQVVTEVRNMSQAGAEKLTSLHSTDKTKTIAQVTSVQTGRKYSGEA